MQRRPIRYFLDHQSISKNEKDSICLYLRPKVLNISRRDELSIMKVSTIAILSCLILFASPFFISFSTSAQSSPSVSAVVTHKCTDCWSGYSDTTSKSGEVTAVYSSFIVEAIPSCANNGKNFQMLVGAAIDGSSAKDFAFVGAWIICFVSGGVTQQSLTPYFCDQIFCVTNSFQMSPGDTIQASLVVKGSNFNGTIIDDGVRVGTWSEPDTGAKLNMGSCISDMFYSSNGDLGGYLMLDNGKPAGMGTGVTPQPNFGVIKTGNAYTMTKSTCDTTINGTTKPVGSQSGVTITEWSAYSKAGKALISVSKLTDSTSFEMTYKAAGP
jgi:hypothetical protein